MSAARALRSRGTAAYTLILCNRFTTEASRYARSGIGENRSLGTDVATMMLALPSTKVPSGTKRSFYAGHERLGARVTRRR